MIELSVPIFERRVEGLVTWRSLGLGPFDRSAQAPTDIRAQRQLGEELRRAIAAAEPSDLEWFRSPVEVSLARLSLDLKVEGRRVSGVYPVVVETRATGRPLPLVRAYHPELPAAVVVVDPAQPLAAQVQGPFAKAWAAPGVDPGALLADRRMRLTRMAFSARPPTLLERAKAEALAKQKGELGRPPRAVLPELGADLTLAGLEDPTRVGVPRPEVRDRVFELVRSGRSVLLVGPPGAGKTTVLHRLIGDLLEVDGFAVHRNLDRVHHVWSISGNRLLAGMSHFGEWEQRALDLVAEVRRHGKILLYAEDVVGFPRLGQSRSSERSLATFFSGPLADGALVMLGECTPAGLAELEDEAPAFLRAFHVVRVPAATEAETLAMMLADVRRRVGLEFSDRRWVSPELVVPAWVYAAVLEATRERRGRALPGRAIDELGRRLEKVRGHASDQDWTAQVLGDVEEDCVGDYGAVFGELTEHVLGQDEAVTVVAEVLERRRARLHDPRRPCGVVLLTGPTGTGKTELAKVVARRFFGGDSALLRFDMAEYGTPDAVARLVGDRFRPDGELTRRVRQRPVAVLLFDEIEKAHPAVLGLFLQLFEDGRLTDARGETVDFTGTLVLMTSNLGAKAKKAAGFGEHEAALDDAADREIQGFFAPELYNRIDGVARFRPLAREALDRIAAIELSRLVRRRGLGERGIFVRPCPSAVALAVERGYDPELGARPMKRVLDQEAGLLLAERIASRAPERAVHLLHAEAGRFSLRTVPLSVQGQFSESSGAREENFRHRGLRGREDFSESSGAREGNFRHRGLRGPEDSQTSSDLESWDEERLLAALDEARRRLPALGERLEESEHDLHARELLRELYEALAGALLGADDDEHDEVDHTRKASAWRAPSQRIPVGGRAAAAPRPTREAQLALLGRTALLGRWLDAREVVVDRTVLVVWIGGEVVHEYERELVAAWGRMGALEPLDAPDGAHAYQAAGLALSDHLEIERGLHLVTGSSGETGLLAVDLLAPEPSASAAVEAYLAADARFLAAPAGEPPPALRLPIVRRVERTRSRWAIDELTLGATFEAGTLASALRRLHGRALTRGTR